MERSYEMKYDFDKKTDRYGTMSIKYDPAGRGMPDDVLPMWVADMDFLSPPCVAEALAERVKHGIFGYSEPGADYYETVHNWFVKRFGWHTEREWILVTPGVVNAIYIAVRALSSPGDGVTIMQPVYSPFKSAVVNNRRTLFVNELVRDGGHYIIDFEDFENKIKQSKLFILCSPHNPVGRVWTQDELCRIGEICLKHGVIVISDEIHQDFIYPGHKHRIFSGVNENFANMTITCTAPSKTFNLAGLPHANIFIPNINIREKFLREYESCGLGMNGIMSIVACRAAYEYGGEWLDELILYLDENKKLLRIFLQSKLPQIELIEPEGTYLAWLDFSGIGLTEPELDEKIVNEAKLWFLPGALFGAGGENFRRMNIACQRFVLQEALDRLAKTF